MVSNSGGLGTDQGGTAGDGGEAGAVKGEVMMVRKGSRWFSEVPEGDIEPRTREAALTILEFVREDLGLDDVLLKWFAYVRQSSKPPDVPADDPALNSLNEDVHERFRDRPDRIRNVDGWGLTSPRPVIWVKGRLKPDAAAFEVANRAHLLWQQKKRGTSPAPGSKESGDRIQDAGEYAMWIPHYLEKGKDRDEPEPPKPKRKIGFTSPDIK